jgi:hypothetical protein
MGHASPGYSGSSSVSSWKLGGSPIVAVRRIGVTSIERNRTTRTSRDQVGNGESSPPAGSGRLLAPVERHSITSWFDDYFTTLTWIGALA